MYKKVLVSGLSAAVIAQSTLPTVSAAVETNRMKEAFYEGLIQDLEQQIAEAEVNLEVQSSFDTSIAEVTSENSVEASYQVSVEVEPVVEEEIEALSTPVSGSFSDLSVSDMKAHLYQDADEFLTKVESQREEVEAKLLEEGLSLDTLEIEVKAAQDGAKILRQAADTNYKFDLIAKPALIAAHGAFDLVINRWDNYVDSGWMNDYTTKLETTLVEFNQTIEAFEAKVAEDYESFSRIIDIDSQKAKADAAIAEAKTFIQDNQYKIGNEAKNALISFNLPLVGAKAKFESAQSEWNEYIESGGIDSNHQDLNKALDEFQQKVTSFSEKLETDYERYQGAPGIDEAYKVAKAAVDSSQSYIDSNRSLTGKDAEIALNISLPAQKLALETAANIWNTLVSQIEKDTLELIVNDLVSWISQNASKVDYTTVINMVLEGVLEGESAEVIINDVISTISDDVDIISLTTITLRAVIWYQYNPEKDELIQSVIDKVTTSDAYIKLVEAREQLEKLKEYIESGQLDTDLEAVIKEELAKLETKMEALIQDLITQGAGAVQTQVDQLIKDIENFVNKILNSDELKQIQQTLKDLKALIEVIQEIEDYLQSDQLQQEVELIKDQIQELIQNILTKTEEQIRNEMVEIIKQLDKYIEKVVTQVEADLATKLEVLEQWIEKAEACMNSESGQALIETVKMGISELEAQLQLISDLIESKQYYEAIKAKKDFVQKIESFINDIKTIVGDKDLCKPVLPPAEDNNQPTPPVEEDNNQPTPPVEEDNNQPTPPAEDDNDLTLDDEKDQNSNFEDKEPQNTTQPSVNSNNKPVTGIQNLGYAMSGLGLLVVGTFAHYFTRDKKLERKSR